MMVRSRHSGPWATGEGLTRLDHQLPGDMKASLRQYCGYCIRRSQLKRHFLLCPHLQCFPTQPVQPRK